MCFGVGALIYLGIGLSCLLRGFNAMKINADYEHDYIDRAYDSCSVPYFSRDRFEYDWDKTVREN